LAWDLSIHLSRTKDEWNLGIWDDESLNYGRQGYGPVRPWWYPSPIRLDALITQNTTIKASGFYPLSTVTKLVNVI
jgi:hypothetical protein